MKKRILSILLIITIPLSFCSCSSYASVKVNGTKISNGVYTYFLDRAENESEGKSEDDIKKTANEFLSAYVAINSEFEKRNLTLSVDEKTSLSESVNVDWQYFSKYYEQSGITKQDYYNIKSSEAYREKLMEYYYSEKGDAPVSDKELQEYFNNNFVAFRAVTSFLTTVDSENNTVSLSAQERKKITSAFEKMAKDINENKYSLEAVATYAENTIITNEIVVINKNSTDYPDGFFDNVMKLENDKAGSFTIGDYIFTVQKSDINSKEFNFFQMYKKDCLKALKAEEFDSVVELWSKYYIVEEK